MKCTILTVLQNNASCTSLPNTLIKRTYKEVKCWEFETAHGQFQKYTNCQHNPTETSLLITMTVQLQTILCEILFRCLFKINSDVFPVSNCCCVVCFYVQHHMYERI
mmetsp:Transcript_8965/g.55132  ORF Transcript_8965/g.55132 Transcript_8965/m.55132 type:complete len:107 (+) Transcript_8965:100-420(+)